MPKHHHKVNISTASHQLDQQTQQNQGQDQAGRSTHSPASLPHMSSKRNVSRKTYESQLEEYRREASKLSTVEHKIEFWLAKATQTQSHIVPPYGFAHNYILQTRSYLREAIALGSVEAALQHDQLIQKAIQLGQFDILGSQNTLRDPITQAVARSASLLQLLCASNVSSENKSRLESALIEALGTQPRARVVNILLQTEVGNIDTRNEVARYVLTLPQPSNAQQGLQVTAYQPGGSSSPSNTNAASSSSSSASNNNAKN